MIILTVIEAPISCCLRNKKFYGLTKFRMRSSLMSLKICVVFFSFPQFFCFVYCSVKFIFIFKLVSLVVVIYLPTAAMAVCIFIHVQWGQRNDICSPAFKASVLKSILIGQAQIPSATPETPSQSRHSPVPDHEVDFSFLLRSEAMRMRGRICHRKEKLAIHTRWMISKANKM